METLKKLKKHDHTLTDIIKAFIFGLVLLAPCFAILTKCLYVINNKNANQSYLGNTINESIKNNGYKDLTTYYELTMGNMNITNQIIYTIKNVKVEGNAPQTILDNQEYINTLVFYIQDSNKICRVSFNNGTTNNFWFYGATTYASTTISFYLDTLPDGTNGETFLYYYTYNKNSFLDNAFYYAVNEMKDSELFGWTKGTAIYTAVNGMCSGLAVQNGALPVLITYWTLMTAIYIILDIVIFVFKKITHFMQ